LKDPKTKRQQMKCTYDALENFAPKFATYRKLSWIFDLHKSRFATIIQQESDEDYAPGTNLKFPPEVEQQFVTEINSRYSDGLPFSPITFLAYVKTITDRSVTKGWVGSFVTRHSTEVMVGKAAPLERARFNVVQEYVDSYVEELHTIVQRTPPCLLFNVDECGIDPFVDAKQMKVLAPATCDRSSLVYRVERKPQHITLTLCISLGGVSLTPHIITRRKTLENDLTKEGLILDEDMTIAYSEKGYMTTELFLDWARSVFFPGLARIREEKGTGGAWATLLLDGFSGHTNTEVIAEMEANGVHLVYFPPHSTHVFQPLDLTIFGGLKAILRNYHEEHSLSAQAETINKIINAAQDSTTKHKIIAAFRRAGILLECNASGQFIEIDVTRIQEGCAKIKCTYPETGAAPA
jgi:hypothetical protein